MGLKVMPKKSKTNPENLVKQMLDGNESSLARLITLVESESPQVTEILKRVHPHVGNAYKIGITGPTGAGKSTVIEKLTSVFRQHGNSIGIICVDPTSPFSGGAFLGDRIRMKDHYLDAQVFIRSMATRGCVGGLASTVRRVIKLLDAFGKDIMLVETVGVGQSEMDIMKIADTVIVVLMPECGDTIQAMKAGIMEIGDIYVVNKADRPGANQIVAALKSILSLQTQSKNEPVILTTEAVNDVGIVDLFEHIESTHKMLSETGQLIARRRQQRYWEFVESIEQRIFRQLSEFINTDATIAEYLSGVEDGKEDPYIAADEFMNKGLSRMWAKKL